MSNPRSTPTKKRTPAANATPAKNGRRMSIDVVDPTHAVNLATRQTYNENVFLFIPNLIGYARVILAGLALNYMPHHPRYCTLLYGISCLLDAVDGQAARAFGQTSKFGAVLDMVTDRCTTSCLLCFLSSAYPQWALLFQLLITLDFSSHYMHMYSSLATGSRSHKIVRSEVSRILWYYYNDSRTLFLFCAGNELFYVALYLMHFDKTPIGGFFPFLSAAFASYAYSVPQLLPPAQTAKIAATIATLSWAQLMAIITFPVCLGKNIINVVQGWKASKILVGIDLAERARERELLEMREE